MKRIPRAEELALIEQFIHTHGIQTIPPTVPYAPDSWRLDGLLHDITEIESQFGIRDYTATHFYASRLPRTEVPGRPWISRPLYSRRTLKAA